MSKVNLLNIAKDPGLFRAFRAPEGETLIYIDFCLHPKTELLTRRGWVPVLNVCEDDEVWQVNKDSFLGSWARPSRVIKTAYKGLMHTFGNVRGTLSVTSGHRMLWVGQRGHSRPDKKNYRLVQLSDLGVTSTMLHMATSTLSNTTSNFSEWEIWMACMLQADGSIYNRRGVNLKYHIEVRKERKKAKVQELLGRPGIPRKEGGMYWAGIDFESPLLDNNTKTFKLSQLGSNQVSTFMEALAFWDGSADNSGRVFYGSVVKDNVEEVQRYLTTNGYEARMRFRKFENDRHNTYYYLSIKKGRDIRLRKCDHSTEGYSGPVGCVTVPEGFILVRSEGQTFVTGNCAVEPHVMAQLSQDPNMMKLYRRGAPKNDFYLFSGAHMSMFSEEIRRWYDPDNPTPETISAAKKNCSATRNLLKPTCLMLLYNAWIKRLQLELNQAGYNLTFSDAQRIYNDFWEAYRFVRLMGESLKRQWERNGGWVYNGRGRPLTVDAKYLSDLTNRVCQSTGHDLLMRFLFFINTLRHERRVPMRPYLCDLHDSTTWTIKTEALADGVQIYRDSLKLLNDELGWDVEISGQIKTGQTLADFLDD